LPCFCALEEKPRKTERDYGTNDMRKKVEGGNIRFKRPEDVDVCDTRSETPKKERSTERERISPMGCFEDRVCPRNVKRDVVRSSCERETGGERDGHKRDAIGVRQRENQQKWLIHFRILTAKTSDKLLCTANYIQKMPS
jgi:hypothetical protein